MNAIVFGASGGIGRALTEQLVGAGKYETVFAASRTDPGIDGARYLNVDILSDDSLASVGASVKAGGPLSLCVVATGFLSDDDVMPEKSYRHQTLAAFNHVFAMNTFAPGLIAKHMLPLYARGARGVFAALSARVGSISDNRKGGWHAYRASKAALNMLIQNYAIEQARRNENFICVALHPGTVDTSLSEPFQSNVPEKQLFSPDQSAGCLLSVINGLHPEDTGKVFDWAGEEIAP
jgi:NAD(P)-dependent dehydrogenase (short-subunit alcohol dehydrogenase family)